MPDARSENRAQSKTIMMRETEIYEKGISFKRTMEVQSPIGKLPN